MVRHDYRKLEDKIVELFKKGRDFQFNDNNYEVLFSSKPKTQKGGGEPKTDVFIRSKSIKDKNILDLKISVKIDMKSIFVENKIKQERFEEIFSQDTKKNILEMFFKEVFPKISKIDIYKKKVIPLGWKCEILINDNRKMRIRIPLSRKEAEEIYSGKKRPIRFRDALVNEKIIKDSGIANYILFTNEKKINCIEDIISKIQPISNYVEDEKHRIFDIVLTTLNMRFKEDNGVIFKWDGDRPLLLGVKWGVKKNKIQGFVELNSLFKYKGNEMARLLSDTINQASANMQNVSSFWKSLAGKIAQDPIILLRNIKEKSPNIANLERFLK